MSTSNLISSIHESEVNSWQYQTQEWSRTLGGVFIYTLPTKYNNDCIWSLLCHRYYSGLLPICVVSRSAAGWPAIVDQLPVMKIKNYMVASLQAISRWPACSNLTENCRHDASEIISGKYCQSSHNILIWSDWGKIRYGCDHECMQGAGSTILSMWQGRKLCWPFLWSALLLVMS